MACSIVCVHNLYSQDYYYRQITCSIMYLCNNLVLCFPQPLCTLYTRFIYYFSVVNVYQVNITKLWLMITKVLYVIISFGY